jgi:hypothetical protein
MKGRPQGSIPALVRAASAAYWIVSVPFMPAA